MDEKMLQHHGHQAIIIRYPNEKKYVVSRIRYNTTKRRCIISHQFHLLNLKAHPGSMTILQRIDPSSVVFICHSVLPIQLG